MLPFMPMLIGAALGGGISAARGGNPLTGALLGAAGGAFGGATGLLGSTTGATTAGTVGATGGGFTGGGFGSIGLAGQTASAAAPSGFLANTMAGIGQDLSAVQAFAKENPFITNQVGGLAKQALFPEQQPMAQGPGIIRGQQMPQQQPQYNPYAAPNISLI
jgi:hypothetical protein